MLGLIWWPMVDQLDWDGALTHRVGKIHEVGLFNLRRQSDGSLTRHATPLVAQYAKLAAAGDGQVGELGEIAYPVLEEDQGPPIAVQAAPLADTPVESRIE